MDVYDLLDSTVMESIGFREFCALIYLVSASESGLLVRCLFDHGALLFDILGAGQPLITGERLKVLGMRVLSIKDDIILGYGRFYNNSQCRRRCGPWGPLTAISKGR